MLQDVDFLVTPAAPVAAWRIDTETVVVGGVAYPVRGPGAGMTAVFWSWQSARVNSGLSAPILPSSHAWTTAIWSIPGTGSACVRLCARLLEHEAYQDIVAQRLAPSDQELASDNALDAWLLQHVTTTQHISGTCKMGPASDPLAVGDQHCRVHGLTGLHVADASVLPDVIRANTNATTIMIAERVADFIRHRAYLV